MEIKMLMKTNKFCFYYFFTFTCFYLLIIMAANPNESIYLSTYAPTNYFFLFFLRDLQSKKKVSMRKFNGLK